ncbi:Abhydrolase-4 domain-containing protein [Mycena chlorophos]|uniref:Abhydrolase-4 domain-containing protein n=1 Tax=Mycena chlorophos TaxID=658473 RepID=A0A8H6WMU1_MYCCL|nr:Abhydrolase-4 domain-containing protein [Mycena chlorophos]
MDTLTRVFLFLLSTVAVLFVLLFGAFAFVPEDVDVSDDPPQLEPSDELRWVDCYGTRQCARLKVPLNYSDPEGDSAVIALARIPSKLAPDSPSYRGPLLFNPGGPGGSGVDFVIASGYGELFQLVVGPEFDLIGFDPRGIARSTPRANFFASRVERELFAKPEILLSLNASANAIARQWADATLIGQLAAENDDGTLRFINTENTARDMLEIVRKHGREKIQYWGFSYGTILGATFAAMFPDNIERFIIDGVMDAESYYSTQWSDNLQDTDKVLQSFATGCFSAGPSTCPFYAASPAAILANMDALAESLRSRPIPVRTPKSYGLVDYSLFRTTIFYLLYSPYAKFPMLAQALADLAQGNATRLWEMSPTGLKPPFECSCDDRELGFESVPESLWAVLCNDGDRISPEYEEFEAHYRMLSNLSSFADQWERPRMGCLTWPDLPKPKFRGPFIGNTSFPLLLIGNTADPVTPLASAQKMSKGFKDSVVLTQDSPGDQDRA